ncbi:kirola [Gossypium raimondii]|uniref:Bet v I/Major latex protein domain-containing protein n=2 Tax=Gossypium TaxID=3633 RepID=A0A0D2VZ31_GOSRA|nr:kirola [Gossypium raimondii]KJB77390.1 hypothetical protein B456_012G135200 [Gossypium raimondii]
MAQIKRMECQLEIKSSADKFFDAYKTKAQLMPKMANQVVRDVKLVEGSGWDSEGSVRQWYFVAAGKLETCKEMMEKVNDKDRTIVYKLVEGEIMKAFKSWNSILNVMPMGEGSLVKWTMEFEKQNDDVPDPVKYGEFLTTWAKNVDTYLLNV